MASHPYGKVRFWKLKLDEYPRFCDDSHETMEVDGKLPCDRYLHEPQASDDFVTIDSQILRSKSFVHYIACLHLFKETMMLDELLGRFFKIKVVYEATVLCF